MDDKARALVALRDILNQWKSLLGSLREPELTAPLPGGLSVKDEVAHLRAWQMVTVARLEAAQLGREPPGSLLAVTAGPVRPVLLPLLLVMPAVAVGVYAVAAALAPPVEVIYGITAIGGVMATAVLGGLVYLIALLRTVGRRRGKQQPGCSEKSPVANESA